VSPTYRDNPGPMLWRILSALDSNISTLDDEPFRRNDFPGDGWNRTLAPLQADLSTPRAHLQYMVAVRSHTPSGRSMAGGMMEMTANVEIAFAFLAVHNAQWDYYRLSMQASHMLRNMVLGCGWASGAGLDPITVALREAYQPAAIPGPTGSPSGGTAGLVITQRFDITHVEGLTR
jgi:hypothetical protein